MNDLGKLAKAMRLLGPAQGTAKRDVLLGVARAVLAKHQNDSPIFDAEAWNAIRDAVDAIEAADLAQRRAFKHIARLALKVKRSGE